MTDNVSQDETRLFKIQDFLKGQVKGMLKPSSMEIDLSKTFFDLGLDSLDCVEIAMSLEDEFSVEIPDKKISEVSTLQEMADLVNSLEPPKI